MRNTLIIFLFTLLYSCTGIISSERQKICNPINGETIYLKYCKYDNGHDATTISLDSIFKGAEEMCELENNPVDDYIAYYDDPHFFFKLSNDTLKIYCYGIFQMPKNYHKFKTKIDMIDMDVVMLDQMKKNYKKMKYTAFPKCNFEY